MKKVMVRAWEIAREGAKKFGGKAVEYIAEALKLAWKEVKNAVKAQLKGTAKQVAWAEDIREAVVKFIERCAIKGIAFYEEKGKKYPKALEKAERAKAQLKEVISKLNTEEDAGYWIDNWASYYKKEWKISSGILRNFGDKGLYPELVVSISRGKR